MDYRSLTALAFRVTGVLILVGAVAQLPSAIVATWSMVAGWNSPLSASAVLAPVALTLGAVLLQIALAVALIVFPNVVANRIMDPHLPAHGSTVEFESLQSIAFTTLGLYFFAEGMVGIAWAFFPLLLDRLGVYAEDRGLASIFTANSWTGLARAAIRSSAGLVIILGARGLSRLINRVRGYPASEA